MFLPLLSTRQIESFVIVEDYQALVNWLQQWGIEAPPEDQVNAADTSTFTLNCKEGEPAYAAFRVGPGSMSSIFSLVGMPSIDTLRQSNCPTNSCMGAHVWHGAKGVTVLSHVVYGVFSAGHLFAGCV